jgi:hypothetical protein
MISSLIIILLLQIAVTIVVVCSLRSLRKIIERSLIKPKNTTNRKGKYND